MDDVAVDVGETEVAARVAVRQFGVVKSEEVQDSGVKVMDMYWILLSFEPKLIGRSVNGSSLDTAARHPIGEAVMVVVTTA